MVESLFVFGNGLGRALDDQFFSLQHAMNAAWSESEILTEKQRQLIRSCLPDGVIEENVSGAPASEAELEDLQRVLSACDTIKSFEFRVNGANEEGWLSEHGREFPIAIRKYVHKAACYFHDRTVLSLQDSKPYLPTEFQSSLRAFIMKHGAHVATLNYDDLLYDCFTDTDVFRRYKLRDGFRSGKFDLEGLESFHNDKTDGWFLHLHGSPLFVNIEGQPRKVERARLGSFQGNESTHLVLTSVNFKRNIISQSEVLSAYWSKLKEIIPQLKNIVVFGYGGLDLHLNEALEKADEKANIRIVEFNNGETKSKRMSFWSQQLKRKDIEVIQLDNVLLFAQWEGV